MRIIVIKEIEIRPKGEYPDGSERTRKSWMPGQIADVNPKKGKKLIDKGKAREIPDHVYKDKNRLTSEEYERYAKKNLAEKSTKIDLKDNKLK